MVGTVNPDGSIELRPDIYFENLDDGSITLTQGDGTPYGKQLLAARSEEILQAPNVDELRRQITEQNRANVARDAGEFDPTGLALAAITIALAPATGGISLAIGEAILGAGAVGAATLGSAIVGSAISAVGAVATDGDVVKSAVTGAITGGAGANATDIGTAIAGGADNVQAIATALDLTTKQVTTAITNAVTTGVVTAAISDADVGTSIVASLTASVVGAYTTDLVANIPDLKDVSTLVGNVSSVATKATINGTDVGDALITNVGSIIGGYVADTATKTEEIKNEITKEITSTTEAGDVSDQNPGTQVTLADGSKGVVSNSGVIEAVDATTGMTTVGFKEPTGTVSISGVVMENKDSPSGFSDDQGNPVNQDGTPFLDPNAVDVASEKTETVIEKDKEILDLINPVVKKDETVATDTTGTTGVTNVVDPTATTTATTVADTIGATGTTGGVTDITDTTGVIDTTTGVDTGGVSTTTSGGTGTDVVGTGVDTGGGFRGTATDTTTTVDPTATATTTTTVDPNQAILDLISTTIPLKTDTVDAVTTTDTVPTKTDLTSEPITVTGTTDPAIDAITVEQEETKPYTPFEEDFPLQSEEPKSVKPTVIPKKPSKTSRSTKNAQLSTGLGIDTNVASLLGTGLSTRPDVSSTSEPYLLGKDDKRKNVWNTESLRGALGI